MRRQGRTNVLQSVRGNERLDEVVNLKEVGAALVVDSRLCRIKTLKWARGWPIGASVPVDQRRVRAFGCLLVVTARGEGFGPVAVLVSLEGEEGQESIGSGAR